MPMLGNSPKAEPENRHARFYITLICHSCIVVGLVTLASPVQLLNRNSSGVEARE